MAAATLIYGNLAALPQNNLKRLLRVFEHRARGLSAHGGGERRGSIRSAAALPLSAVGARLRFIWRRTCR